MHAWVQRDCCGQGRRGGGLAEGCSEVSRLSPLERILFPSCSPRLTLLSTCGGFHWPASLPLAYERLRETPWVRNQHRGGACMALPAYQGGDHPCLPPLARAPPQSGVCLGTGRLKLRTRQNGPEPGLEHCPVCRPDTAAGARDTPLGPLPLAALVGASLPPPHSAACVKPSGQPPAGGTSSQGQPDRRSLGTDGRRGAARPLS
jgi:hypothetical protein